jgi:pimeloyl-ACP methyl ester carboxylesterase
MTATTHTLTIENGGSVQVAFTERGEGRPTLLLHGGGGPSTVESFAELLAATERTRVLVPIHPGFAGTPRPSSLTTIRGLAALYVALLDELGLTDVTVIGNSIGGWIAAEMALLGSPRLSRIALVDAVGIEVADHPVADFFGLTMDQVAQLSYYDPDTFGIDPSTMPAELQAVMAGNRAALAIYGGTPSMVDPTLLPRLHGIAVPALVLWGDCDRIVDPDYGRAYADAIPTARFQLLTATGHLPQIEAPHLLLTAVREFTDKHTTTTT